MFIPSDIPDYLRHLVEVCYEASRAAGWRSSGIVDIPKDLCLIHSEISEVLEADRKNLMSEKIIGFTGIEEELADAVIRIADLSGALDLKLGQAVLAKLRYNATRADHSAEERAKPHGKKY